MRPPNRRDPQPPLPRDVAVLMCDVMLLSGAPSEFWDEIARLLLLSYHNWDHPIGTWARELKSYMRKEREPLDEHCAAALELLAASKLGASDV